jgi:hypothetical protein
VPAAETDLGPNTVGNDYKPAVLATVGLLCLLLALPTSALAAQAVKLFADFSPNRPGASSTITFGFDISSPGGEVPSPLLSIDLHLPGGIGLARNTLGTAVCEPIYLYAHGPDGCPPDSRMGYGTVLAEVPYGPITVPEHASLWGYRGLPEDQHVTVLFFAEGRTPVFAELVFPGQLLEDTPPFSSRLNTQLPPVPSLPGGPNVSIVGFRSTFGPKNLIYEREVNGELEHYRPRGVTVPASCPQGGYPFAADFSFEDGTHFTARTRAPCAQRVAAGQSPRGTPHGR